MFLEGTIFDVKNLFAQVLCDRLLGGGTTGERFIYSYFYGLETRNSILYQELKI